MAEEFGHLTQVWIDQVDELRDDLAAWLATHPLPPEVCLLTPAELRLSAREQAIEVFGRGFKSWRVSNLDHPWVVSYRAKVSELIRRRRNF